MLSAILSILFSAAPPQVPPSPKIPLPVPAPVTAQEELEDLLVQQLSDEDPKVREHAAVVLAKLGPQAGFAAPELWKAIRSEYKRKKPNLDVVSACRRALRAIGPPLVPMLTTIVSDKKESDWDREDAIGLLSNIANKHGPESIKETIAALTEAAEETNRVGSAAIGALGIAKKTATSALPTLEGQFAKAEGYRKLWLAECLRNIAGPNHPLVKSYFQQMKKDSDLIDAAAKGDLAQVRQLIKEGADVNSEYARTAMNPFQKPGWTALYAATYKGDEEMVKLLLELGANPNVEHDYKTVLVFAKTEELKALLKKAGGRPGAGE